MKIKRTELLENLKADTQRALLNVLEFKAYPIESLNFKSSDADWSILECIEHLNLYGRFYLPEIEYKILNAKPYAKPSTNQYYKSSLLGNYFANMVKASNTKKIKTTQQMDSTGSNLNSSTIDQFIKQLEQLHWLLIKSENVDLSRVKTATSLSKFIKLRLGDTLRFLVYHNERHILQAKRIEIKAAVTSV